MSILPILKLGLIGFVFWGGAGWNIGVNRCGIIGCGDFVVWEIGFVLQKTGRFVEESLQV